MIFEMTRLLRFFAVSSLFLMNPSLKSVPANTLTKAAIAIPYMLIGRKITRLNGTVYSIDVAWIDIKAAANTNIPITDSQKAEFLRSRIKSALSIFIIVRRLLPRK